MCEYICRREQFCDCRGALPVELRMKVGPKILNSLFKEIYIALKIAQMDVDESRQ